MNIEEKLLFGNTNYQKNIRDSISKTKLNKELTKGQHPYALIITCSDSRVIPEEIFSASLGELFVIRSAGNVINDGELASIEYGLKHLHIEYILVLGHTSCGAVHATIHNEEGEYLYPVLSRIKEAIGSSTSERECSMLNAIKQAAYIKEKLPWFKGDIKPGLYDISTNKITVL